jgi:phenylpropionate dioxygenase-like ring-hydroxylating dioxygenase large terminal subunit
MPDDLPAQTRGGLPPDWARPTHDSAAFTAEQKRLAHVWTFLGLTRDVERDGDWFRASIGLRSVFVQRVGGEISGFENRCAHRFFPLRTTDKGNGPIVCGFHHWRYDDDGAVLGIPVCQETFGVVAREVNLRLARLEVATCGSLIFGRFPAPGANDSLADFLGACFPVLEALSRMPRPPLSFSRPVEANWKLCMHIAVDDYHLAAIHSTTFGKGNHYLKRKDLTYTRIGAHSVYQSIGSPNAFADMVSALSGGVEATDQYIVVHLMPGLVLSHAHIWDGYYACGLTHYSPINHHRSQQRTWIFQSPLARPPRGPFRAFRSIRDAALLRIAFRYGRFILGEDAEAAEQLQTNAATFTNVAMLGTLEERVRWYEDAYQKIMATDVGESRA